MEILESYLSKKKKYINCKEFSVQYYFKINTKEDYDILQKKYKDDLYGTQRDMEYNEEIIYLKIYPSNEGFIMLFSVMLEKEDSDKELDINKEYEFTCKED